MSPIRQRNPSPSGTVQTLQTRAPKKCDISQKGNPCRHCEPQTPGLCTLRTPRYLLWDGASPPVSHPIMFDVPRAMPHILSDSSLELVLCVTSETGEDRGKNASLWSTFRRARCDYGSNLIPKSDSVSLLRESDAAEAEGINRKNRSLCLAIGAAAHRLTINTMPRIWGCTCVCECARDDFIPELRPVFVQWCSAFLRFRLVFVVQWVVLYWPVADTVTIYGFDDFQSILDSNQEWRVMNPFFKNRFTGVCPGWDVKICFLFVIFLVIQTKYLHLFQFSM